MYWHSTNDMKTEGGMNIVSLTTLPGVMRQGDGRGPAQGDFLSWQPNWSWYSSDHKSIPQPNGNTGENCFMFNTHGVNAGKWGDHTCSALHYYVCERTVPPTD